MLTYFKYTILKEQLMWNYMLHFKDLAIQI